MRIHCILLCVILVGVANGNGSGNEEEEKEAKRRTVLEQLTKTRTVLLDGYHLVTRQIASDIQMYRSYRTVTVIFYPILRDVTDARFTFQSEELHLNTIGSCAPLDVIINIKRASYPAVNPDGYDFPKEFIDPSAREPIHTIEVKSDGKSKTYSIRNPTPGNWYAIVYIKWQDPRTEKVTQQGLVADCSTIVYTDLQVKREENIENFDCYSGLVIDFADLPAAFKCMSIDSTEPIGLNVTVINTTNSQSVLFRIQALSLPKDDAYLVSCAFDPKLSNTQTITFSPHPSSWHYIHIEHIPNTNASNHANCESYYYRTDMEDTYSNHSVSDLMRDDAGRFFTFDYGIPKADVQDTTSLFNLTSNEIKSVRFKVNQFIDIGGTLQFEVSLIMSLKYYMGFRRGIKKGSLLAFTEDSKFFRAVICLDIGHTSIPLSSGHCKYNDIVKPALFVLNSTDSESIYEKAVIPYPDSGTWYLTFRLFCDDVVCPCRTSHNGTRYYVDSELPDTEGENISGEVTNHTREGEKQCNATLLLSISSHSCISGRCANHGRCMLNTIGGMVMSYCQCNPGYGAWDCSDSSRMDSMYLMLVSVLLLTLSNLLFFFSIYIAIIRRYFTEAMMYAFTLFFSTFYHACDAPDEISMCITKGRILQFGDFYCGIMCFWVTLLAMSILAEGLRSSLQLTGAVVIALLTFWNMHSFLTFMLPVAAGVGTLFVSWGLDYYSNRRFPYPKSYYIRHFPVGVVLVLVGLICYAFLQTEQNYKIVHSVWHAIIALSVVFLLPDARREGDPNPFLPKPDNRCKIFFRKLFKRPRGSLSMPSPAAAQS